MLEYKVLSWWETLLEVFTVSSFSQFYQLSISKSHGAWNRDRDDADYKMEGPKYHQLNIDSQEFSQTCIFG